VAQGLVMAEAKQDAQEVLDRLEIQLDTAACNVEAVMLAQQEVALEAAIELEDAPDPPVLAEKLTAAAEAVGSGESIAKSVRPQHPGVAGPLLDRAIELRERVRQLRVRLSALQERI